MKIKCAHCGNETEKSIGHINRANKVGLLLFCNKHCFGLYHRVERTNEEKKQIKREYDIQYREKKRDELRIKKKAYYESPAGRAVQKRAREKRKDYHSQYIKSARYRKWKHDYDQINVAKNNYGEFYESALILKNLEREIMPERKEIKQQLGILNKSQKRKRLWEKMNNILHSRLKT